MKQYVKEYNDKEYLKQLVSELKLKQPFLDMLNYNADCGVE